MLKNCGSKQEEGYDVMGAFVKSPREFIMTQTCKKIKGLLCLRWWSRVSSGGFETKWKHVNYTSNQHYGATLQHQPDKCQQ